MKEAPETAIVLRYPSDIFRTFDELWEGFRRDFLRPWRPWITWSGPWGSLARREVRTDLYDLGEEFQVCVEVPGIPKDQLDITITKDRIEISGKTKVERTEEEQDYVVRERGYSEVYKRISFPEDVVPNEGTATLKDGLLYIRVPKQTPTPKPEAYKVEIQ